MSLLKHTHPELAKALEAFSFSEAKHMLLETCKHVGESVVGLEDEIKSVLQHSGAPAPLETTRRLVKYSAWADERYFSLKEKGIDQAVWSNWFDKARLADALSISLSRDSFEGIMDGFYELSVIGNGVAVIAFIQLQVNSRSQSS